MLNFVENLLENERGPMNDQDLTKTDYDPDRSLVLIEGLSHFLTNFVENLTSCHTAFSSNVSFVEHPFKGTMQERINFYTKMTEVLLH
jgi:hypothetical protein